MNESHESPKIPGALSEAIAEYQKSGDISGFEALIKNKLLLIKRSNGHASRVLRMDKKNEGKLSFAFAPEDDAEIDTRDSDKGERNILLNKPLPPEDLESDLLIQPALTEAIKSFQETEDPSGFESLIDAKSLFVKDLRGKFCRVLRAEKKYPGRLNFWFETKADPSLQEELFEQERLDERMQLNKIMKPEDMRERCFFNQDILNRAIDTFANSGNMSELQALADMGVLYIRRTGGALMKIFMNIRKEDDGRLEFTVFPGFSRFSMDPEKMKRRLEIC